MAVDLVAGVTEKRVANSAILAIGSREISFYERRGKRVFDIVVSLFLLVMLTPIFLVIAIAARISLNRGLLFRQERVGLNGEAFECLKFRTMEHDRRTTQQGFDSSDRRLTHKSDTDPRHTRVGRFMRKFSLDELPQLINVLKGDMSLVGPRPELIAVATAEFIEHPRHWVRPGLTGPYQISELRRTGDLRAGLRLDATYVANVGLRNDLGYLLRTVAFCLRGTGA